MENGHDRGLFQHEGGTHYLHLLREVLLTYRQLLKQLSLYTGLTGAQFEVMRELALGGGSSTVSALARELGVDRAAVSRTIADLQEGELVTRERNERDRRSQPVVLSEKGSRLMVAFHARAHEYESALTGDLDPESVETAMRVLRTLRDALDAIARDRPGSRPDGKPAGSGRSL